MILPVFVYRQENESTFVVISTKSFDYTTEWTGWMDDPVLDEWSLIPHIDIIEDRWVFDGPDAFENEKAALRKVAELYAEQL